MNKNIFLIFSCLIISSFLHGNKEKCNYKVARNAYTNIVHVP